MIALSIEKVRPFMAALLMKDTFDSFQLREGTVTTFCTYNIEGSYQKSFFDGDSDEAEDSDLVPAYAPWSLVRPHIFDMIRGNRTPLSFRLVFYFSGEAALSVIKESGYRTDADNLKAFFLNMHFNGKVIRLTTGSSQAAFPPDREFDRLWDAWIRNFLLRNALEYEEL